MTSNAVRMFFLMALAVITVNSDASAQLGRRLFRFVPQRNYHYPQAPPATPQEVEVAKDPGRFALIIATREYPNAKKLGSLPGVCRDAFRMAKALRDGGYPDENVIVICDDAIEESQRPTKVNIESQLTNVLSRAVSPDNVVSVFATGHGVALNGVSYLCPSDASDESLASPAAAQRELVSVADIATRLSQECVAENKILVVDACRDTSNQQTGDYVKNFAALETPAEGVWLMSSCSEGQFSWMSDKIEPGERRALFSHYLAEGLSGAADLVGDNDGEVGLFELYTYGLRKTKASAFEIQEEQTPELFGVASPFTVATSRSFVSRRKLTTNDPLQENRRSALQMCDAAIQLERQAMEFYRKAVSAEGVGKDEILKRTDDLHLFLCHLLGNRVRAALTLDPDCKLAHLTRGIAFRTCGMYEESLDGFRKGGEHLELFVKADPKSLEHFMARDESGDVLKDEIGRPIPQLHEGRTADEIGVVELFASTSGTQVKRRVNRQSKVQIGEVQGEWLQVTAINDQAVDEPVWINQASVHWFPEAVDVYTPSTPMRPVGTGMAAATRMDSMAGNLYAMSDRLAAPARRIELAAVPFVNAASRLHAAGSRARMATNGINRIGGFFGFSVPNPVADALDYAGGVVSIPAGHIHRAASYVRIPSGYVSMAGGYAQTAGNFARTAQQLTGSARSYQTGHERSQEIEDARNELAETSKLKPVREKPVRVAVRAWIELIRDKRADRQEL